MKYNRLSLNHTKSTYLISAPKQKRVALQNFQLHVGGHKLSNTDCVKYLGVFVDKKISWKQGRSQKKIERGPNFATIIVSSFSYNGILPFVNYVRRYYKNCCTKLRKCECNFTDLM